MATQPIEELPELWELAVRLDVLLCYPNAPDTRRRRSKAIGGQLVEVTLEHLRNEAPELLAASAPALAATFPEYDAAARRRISPRFMEIHERALKVGSIVLALVSKAATGHYPRFVGGTRQPSLNEVARYVLEMDGPPADEDEVHQFLKTEVRPWYPVAHLAGAFQLTAREYASRGAVMTFDYQDTGFFAEILRRADKVAEDIRATPSQRKMADRLVPLDEFDRLR